MLAPLKKSYDKPAAVTAAKSLQSCLTLCDPLHGSPPSSPVPGILQANLDSILKNRDITFPTKAPIVKAMVFPVVMYGCESWTIKKVECRKIDAFEPWCWRRSLRVPWTARRSNGSILKEISGEYSLEKLMLKLKFPIFWPPDVKCWLTGKDPDAGKDRRQEEKGTTEDEMVGWHQWLNEHEFEQTLGDGEGQGDLACCSPWCHTKLHMTERLNNNNHQDVKFALMGSSLLGEMEEYA